MGTFTAKPIMVEAYEVAEVVHVVMTGKRTTYLVLIGRDGRTKVTKEMQNKLSPKRGDYFVIFAQDEPQIIPKQVFDARYQEANVL